MIQSLTTPQESYEAWLPPDKITVSQWAEKYRILLPESSAESGEWRNIRTPHLVKIMDSFSEPYIETIVLNKGSQLGGTEVIYNMLGYAIDQDQGPCLFVMPTLELAKSISHDRIQPMINNAKPLAAKKPANDDDFTNLKMIFPGMPIYLAGANSPASLASRPCRYVFMDEINKFPIFSGKEADPESLSTERQKTFWNKKKVMVSTPTEEGGQITRALQSCDVIYFRHVSCPHCGAMQKLEFKNIKWPQSITSDDPDRPRKVRDTAWYECEECQGMITNIQRPQLLASGEWLPYMYRDKQYIPRKKMPDHVIRSVGFSISSLYSPWLTWGMIAEEFLKSKDYPEKLMNFINSWLAEPFIRKVMSASEANILKARRKIPEQTVPQEAMALTCGIDVQKWGFWYVVQAWDQFRNTWVIHYGQLSSFEDVENLLFTTTYPIQDSDHRMPIWRAALDTGGGKMETGISGTEETYMWLRQNKRRMGALCRVWGTKGSSAILPYFERVKIPAKSKDQTPRGLADKYGIKIITINTHEYKILIHEGLQNAIEGKPYAMYLHENTEKVFASHIMAEELREDKRGVKMWEEVSKENHMLDCVVLNYALSDPQWEGGGVNLLRAPLTVSNVMPAPRLPESQQANSKKTLLHEPNGGWLKRKSGWLDRR